MHKEARPQFGFRNNIDHGTDGPDEFSGGNAKIQWRPEDQSTIAILLPSKGMPCFGGDRKHDPMPWIVPAQPCYDALDRCHLAHAHGVDPDVSRCGQSFHHFP